MESNILDIKSLSKSYGKLKALNEVTFSLSEGEYAALLGPNGAGKTTLFQILTGLFVSDNGEVFVNNSNMRNNAINGAKTDYKGEGPNLLSGYEPYESIRTKLG